MAPSLVARKDRPIVNTPNPKAVHVKNTHKVGKVKTQNNHQNLTRETESHQIRSTLLSGTTK